MYLNTSGKKYYRAFLEKKKGEVLLYRKLSTFFVKDRS